MQMQFPGSQGAETETLVRIEPEELPVARVSVQGWEAEAPHGGQGITLRHGGVELELPGGKSIDQVAKLLKVLSGI